jgi:hypothetical protein
MKRETPKSPAKSATEFELDFNAVLQSILHDPTSTNWRDGWNDLDVILAKLSEPEQLQLAGTAIAKLAEAYQRRAEQLLLEWEESHSDMGPAVSDDLLAGLVQRTMYLDISDLVRKPQKRDRAKSKNPRSTESVVGVVEKEKMLVFVTAHQEEQEKLNALKVAHEENISTWVNAIASHLSNHLNSQEPEICFTYLCQMLCQHDKSLNAIKIWLALLLGNYVVEQRGEFYDGNTIWISRDV